MNDKFQYISKRKIIALLVMFIISIVLLYASLSTNKDNTDGEYAAPNLPAFLSYEGSPYYVMNDNTADGFLKKDLAFFARSNYSEYSNDDRIPVEFIVESIEQGNQQKITGKFEKLKNDIEFTVEARRNSRIKLSITDVATGKNIDSQLLSNSAENQFIGTLPVVGSSYTINYEPPNFVSISASFRDPNIFTEAQNKIKSLVGEEVYSQLNISISYPTAGFLDE